MDRDIKEKEKLFQWACKYYSQELTEKIFPSIDFNVGSYFTNRAETEHYLCEYCFQKLPELREELYKMWDKEGYMKEIVNVVLAGAYKNRIGRGKRNLPETAYIEELPQYIYNF